jgi:hypothetical protein
MKAPDLKLSACRIVCLFYIPPTRYFTLRSLQPKTIFEKIWDNHIVYEKEEEEEGGQSLLYIDRHLIHEVTSPQAFDGLRMNKRRVRRPDLTIMSRQLTGRFPL